MSEEEFTACTDSLFDSFESYEHFVGIVSAWEEFFTGMYGEDFDNFYFDRFPEDTASFDGHQIGPSFAVYFSNEYGLLFNLFAKLPREEEQLDRLLQTGEELLPYQFRTRNSSHEKPECVDVVYLIDDDISQTAQHRVRDIITSDESDISSNLVLMSYDYINVGTNPKYEFTRLSMVENNFRDDILPTNKRMSSKLSLDNGGFETIDTPPGFFEDMKSTGVLCNEELSRLYFACYLWHNVFYDYLDDAQQLVWQGKDPKKTLSFELTIDELYDDLQTKYLPTDGIRKSWVSETVSFLQLAGVAEEIDHDEYRIGYRNLQDHRRDHKDVVTSRSDIGDLASLLASWHCEELLDMDMTDRSQLQMDSIDVDIDKDSTQGELGQW